MSVKRPLPALFKAPPPLITPLIVIVLPCVSMVPVAPELIVNGRVATREMLFAPAWRVPPPTKFTVPLLPPRAASALTFSTPLPRFVPPV